MEKLIYKQTNELEKFSKEKILTSLSKLGFSLQEAEEIYENLKDKILQARSSQEIFLIILDYLKINHPTLATKYNLKKGILRFGPTGFPFEKYFARVLNAYGFQTKLNVTLEGKCAIHEIDILAKNQDLNYIIECKFHNTQGIKTDTKHILVLWARYLDLKEKSQSNLVPWIVTNTKITLDAFKFCNCRGIKITSWNWPLDENLFQLITHWGLWPIGILLTLDQKKLEELLNIDVILVLDLFDKDKNLLKNILKEKYDEVMKEAQNLLKETFSKKNSKSPPKTY